MRRRFSRALPLLLVGALLFSACGDDDDDTTSEAGDQPTLEQPDEAAEGDATTTTTGGTTTETSAATTAGKTKPEFEIPAGDPPQELVIEDLEVGTGAEAKAGDTIAVQYVGKDYVNKKQFDASWDRPGSPPFSFKLGAGEVITGWDKGVVGMKVGGRRKLTIPGDQAYGPNGFPPDIAPNDTLVFVIDLVSIG